MPAVLMQIKRRRPEGNDATVSANVRTIMAQKVCRSRENGNLYGASSCVSHPMDSRLLGNDSACSVIIALNLLKVVPLGDGVFRPFTRSFIYSFTP